jgi:hypothetical protein
MKETKNGNSKITILGLDTEEKKNRFYARLKHSDRNAQTFLLTPFLKR